jgi:hypothetical protein
MAKVLKLIGRIIGISLEWIMILVILLLFAVRTSTFQTYLGKLATGYLTSELNSEFHIGKIDIVLFDRVYLKDIFVRDLHGDTLASLNQVHLKVKKLDLVSNHFSFKKLGVYGGRVGLERDSLNGDFNYGFIVDYFKKEKKKKKKKTLPVFSVDQIAVEYVTFSYDDYRKPAVSYGMDYAHIQTNNIILHASNFKAIEGAFYFHVDDLQTQEKCGFWLKDLSTYAVIHPKKGLLMSKLKIESSRSKIYASKMNLRMSSLRGFKSFVDSVSFDGVVDSSHVSMWDISKFARVLEGMRDMVHLKVEVSDKVTKMALRNLDLRFGSRSVIRGNYTLPDYRHFDKTSFNERIDYAFVDLNDVENFILPVSAFSRKIKLNDMVDRLQFVEVKNTSLRGSTVQFNVQSDQLRTSLGSVVLQNELTFSHLNEGGYQFNRTNSERYDLLVDSFELGKFLNNSVFGKAVGHVYLSGIVGQKDYVRLESISGNVSCFDFKGYRYSNIAVEEGTYSNQKVKASLQIDDPNLSLTYQGEIDVSKTPKMDFNASISKANIGKLKFMEDQEASFVGDLEVHLDGNSVQNFEGFVRADNISLQSSGNQMSLPELSLFIERNVDDDRFELRSSLLDADLSGKFDFNTLSITINNGLAEAFPAYFSTQKFPKHKKTPDRLQLDATVKEADDFLKIFVPGLQLAYGTTVHLDLDAAQFNEELTIASSQIAYSKLISKSSDAVFRNVYLTQDYKRGETSLNLKAQKSQLRDSLDIENISINIEGTKNSYHTQLLWNENVANTSEINFDFNLHEAGEFDLLLEPSYFSLKNKVWEIMNKSSLSYCTDYLEINHLMLERENQFLAINGMLSNNPDDYITVNANEIQIDEFSSLLGLPMKMEGVLNGNARVATPFTDIKIDGDVALSNFFLEGHEVGDVQVNGIWLDMEKKLVLNGNLQYKKLETFDFNGYVLPLAKEDNVDLDLEFKDMDISFTNAFINKEVLSEIKGELKGVVRVTGNFNQPEIDGKLALKNAGLKVGILGTHYNLSGPLRFDGENDGIYGSFPVSDEDGNIGFANTTIFHNNFQDFSLSFELLFDETVAYFRNPTTFKQLSAPSKFLVLNTQYKEGSIYYGKAYATGNANIFIEKGNTEIIVNAKTEKGTQIDLPMYGAREVSEFGFIDFSKDTVIQKKKLDLTGVDLALNISATPDANLKLILNDKTNEEIRANGKGDIAIKLDNFGQVQMSGQYVISNGTYFFVLNPIKKNFVLDNGSSIVWTGSPYDANLNIKAYYKVNASLNELNKNQIGGSSETKSEVRCVLNVGNTLSSPTIALDIEAPNASESGKAVLDKIRSDKDEMQRQFFTLLALNRFQGTGASNGSYGGVAEILTQQINSALDQLSKDVKMNVNYNDNAVSGNKNYKFGLEKSFGEKHNVILKTSLGVSNTTSAGNTSNSLIGDFNLDYLINEDGSFRLSIFNESNDKSVLTNKDKGDFTQGVGLHYEESFNNISDSRIIEFITNIFRKKHKVTNSKRKNRVPVDVVPAQPNAVLPDKQEVK